MLYRFLGQTGIKVGVFSYGTWLTFNKLDHQTMVTLIELAYENGINFFDTAEIYGEGQVEVKLGKVLRQLSFSRSRYMVSTKVFWGGPHPTECGLSRKHIYDGCHQSLKRLQVDYIDFYSCHRPDRNTPIEETVIAMNNLIHQGKILYWGTSEWPKEAILEAYHIAKQNHLIPPSVEQFEYNMFCNEMADVLSLDRQNKIHIGTCTTMPLACGILAGQYNNGIPNESRVKKIQSDYFNQLVQSDKGKSKITIAKKLESIAQDMQMTLAQLALYWCLQNKKINTIILGASKPYQLIENLGTLDFFSKQVVPENVLKKMNSLLTIQDKEYDEPTYAEVALES